MLEDTNLLDGAHIIDEVKEAQYKEHINFKCPDLQSKIGRILSNYSSLK